jgi:hypothetical protein
MTQSIDPAARDLCSRPERIQCESHACKIPAAGKQHAFAEGPLSAVLQIAWLAGVERHGVSIDGWLHEAQQDPFLLRAASAATAS